MATTQVAEPQPFYRVRRNEFGTTTHDLILERDDYRCAYCDQPACYVDHVVPRRSGGPSISGNGVAVCLKCNGKKGGKLRERFLARGFFVLLCMGESLAWLDDLPEEADMGRKRVYHDAAEKARAFRDRHRNDKPERNDSLNLAQVQGGFMKPPEELQEPSERQAARRPRNVMAPPAGSTAKSEGSTTFPHAEQTPWGWRAFYPGGSLGFFDNESSATRAALADRKAL